MKDYIDVKKDQLELIRNGVFHYIRSKIHEIDNAPAEKKNELAGELIDKVVDYAKAIDAIDTDIMMFDFANKKSNVTQEKKQVDIFDFLKKAFGES